MRPPPLTAGQILKKMRNNALRLQAQQNNIEEELINNMHYEDGTLKDISHNYGFKKISIKDNLHLLRKQKIIEALEPTIGVDHRLQTLGLIKGVEYIDDSKATNMNCLWFSLTMMKKPVVLIMGGQKTNSKIPESVKSLIEEKVKWIICLGTDNSWVDEQLGNIVNCSTSYTNLRNAIINAQDKAESGDVILFSPGAPSFDLFESYRERGDAFQEELSYM